MNITKLIRYYYDKWKYSVNSYVKQRKDKRDYQYISNTTPNKDTDLREYFQPIKDQGNSNACVAFASAALIEYQLRRHRGIQGFSVSPSFIWYNAKKKHGWELENKGVWTRYGLDVIFKEGFIPEDSMPFNIVQEIPREQDVLFGKMTTKLLLSPHEHYYWMSASDVRSCLTEGNPVIFTIPLNKSFYGNTNGFISLDEPIKGTEHCMVVVGHDDELGYYIVRNSWGVNRFDDGYVYIHYNYFNKYAIDIGTIIDKNEEN